MKIVQKYDISKHHSQYRVTYAISVGMLHVTRSLCVNELTAFNTTGSCESLLDKTCNILSNFQTIFRGNGLLRTGYEYKLILTDDA